MTLPTCVGGSPGKEKKEGKLHGGWDPIEEPEVCIGIPQNHHGSSPT